MVEQTGVRKAAANHLSFNGLVTAMRIQASAPPTCVAGCEPPKERRQMSTKDQSGAAPVGAREREEDAAWMEEEGRYHQGAGLARLENGNPDGAARDLAVAARYRRAAAALRGGLPDTQRDEALRVLAAFARTAPGRLPDRVQRAVDLVPWENPGVALSGTPEQPASEPEPPPVLSTYLPYQAWLAAVAEYRQGGPAPLETYRKHLAALKAPYAAVTDPETLDITAPPAPESE